MSYTVRVHWDLCEGNGICVADAPAVFELDDDDQLVVVDSSPGDEQLARVQKAARSCPKRAIEIVKD